MPLYSGVAYFFLFVIALFTVLAFIPWDFYPFAGILGFPLMCYPSFGKFLDFSIFRWKWEPKGEQQVRKPFEWDPFLVLSGQSQVPRTKAQFPMYYKHATKLYDKHQYIMAELAKSIPSDVESSTVNSRGVDSPTNNGQVRFAQVLWKSKNLKM